MGEAAKTFPFRSCESVKIGRSKLEEVSHDTIQGVDYLEQWLDFIQFMSGGPPVGLGTSGFYCLFVLDFI